MKFKNWKFIEQASGEFVYQNIKNKDVILIYGQYSKDARMPFTSRVGFVELRMSNRKVKNINFSDRKQAKEYAFKYMKYSE